VTQIIGVGLLNATEQRITKEAEEGDSGLMITITEFYWNV
jgi:hypothetical protein